MSANSRWDFNSGFKGLKRRTAVGAETITFLARS